MEEFKKTKGMYNIGEYFMRSHPIDTLLSMEKKGHDRFIAFKTPEADNTSMENLELYRSWEVILTIDDLKDYIKDVRRYD